MIAIFSFEIGDYLRDEKKNLLVLRPRGWLPISSKMVSQARTSNEDKENYSVSGITIRLHLDFIRFVRREVLMVKNEDDVLYTGRLYLFDIPLWKTTKDQARMETN